MGFNSAFKGLMLQQKILSQCCRCTSNIPTLYTPRIACHVAFY